MKSRFEGNLLGLIGVNILAWLITFVTLGIATPWAMCIKYRWEAENTVIEGRRLNFIGSGSSLFMNYIKWWVLTIITFGIYGLWLYIKLLQWKTENTVFEN
ncbi:YjgN family protein [Romboutsia lituseburensis]|uniref:YjgN family protein n=1 Tax=Romboutsia lituseburensis TaxID=1537 RepID=UPI00215A840B|nr:YjgN family protein [Romboutsia lituseburensis]MCR8747108.1 YjgN family protein [Romboutsia lituseburensis]